MLTEPFTVLTEKTETQRRLNDLLGLGCTGVRIYSMFLECPPNLDLPLSLS